MDCRKSIEIDYPKLVKTIQDSGMTAEKFCFSIGKSRNYICSLKKSERVPQYVYNLICEKLGKEQEFFLKRVEPVPAKENKRPPAEPKVFENLFREIAEINAKLETLTENQEALYTKTNTVVLMLAKIKDGIENIGNTEYDRAKNFLIEYLKDGQGDGKLLIAAADEKCIKRSELMKAKGKLGIEIYTTGYGKSQKSWWRLP